MISGIGIDSVDIERFAGQLERTPALGERLFTSSERGLPTHSLAARFAAKEALIKALGGSGELSWHDLEIMKTPEGAPAFQRTPGLLAVLASRGLAHPHLSLTHDGGIASAFVVVEEKS